MVRADGELVSAARGDEGFDGLPRASALSIRCVADIQPEPVDWMWRDRVPAGVVTALAGDGGLGKSTLAIHLAAQVTNGEAVGKTGTRRVGILLCEDSPEAVIQPRLKAAGADLRKVDVVAMPRDGIEGPLALPQDLHELRAYATEHRPDLLIADPVMGLLDGGVDAHRDGGKGGIRAVLGPLHRIAEDVGTTVIAVFHLNKGSGASSQRIGGSAAIRNAVRNVLMVAPHPDCRATGDDDGRRLIGHEKSNYGELQPTLEATVRSAPIVKPNGLPLLANNGKEATTVVMDIDGEADIDYRDALQAASAERKTGDGQSRSALDEAMAFVQEVLADGPMPTTKLEALAADAGIKKRTVDRARSELNVRAAKTAKGWAVTLPGGLGALGADSTNGLAPTGSPKSAKPSCELAALADDWEAML